MRLIDADALIKRCMNGIDNEFIGIVNEIPTVKVLDKIRAEIEAEMNELYRYSSIDQRTLTIIHACQRHIAIIDEYTKGESE